MIDIAKYCCWRFRKKNVRGRFTIIMPIKKGSGALICQKKEIKKLNIWFKNLKFKGWIISTTSKVVSCVELLSSSSLNFKVMTILFLNFFNMFCCFFAVSTLQEKNLWRNLIEKKKLAFPELRKWCWIRDNWHCYEILQNKPDHIIIVYETH